MDKNKEDIKHWHCKDCGVSITEGQMVWLSKWLFFKKEPFCYDCFGNKF